MLLSACERKDGIAVDPSLSTPFITSASLGASIVNLDSTTDVHVTLLNDGSYRITDTISVSVNAPGISIADLRFGFRLISPTGGLAILSGSLRLDNASSTSLIRNYITPFSFNIDRASIGLYRIEVYQTAPNSASNTIHVPLLIQRRNSKPLLGVPTIRTLRPAGSDSIRLSLTIAASDSNGLRDIISLLVFPKNVMDTSSRNMWDNGNETNGDALQGDGIFSAMIWVRPISVTDSVRLNFLAIDSSYEQSAVVTRSLQNHRPRIMNVDVPDSIQRPASGTRLMPFRMTVSDTDGLGDIDTVTFVNTSSSNPLAFTMFDSGDLSLHGDLIANDGIYSRIVSIDAPTTTGVKVFHFEVVDKSGARDLVIRNITVY